MIKGFSFMSLVLGASCIISSCGHQTIRGKGESTVDTRELTSCNKLEVSAPVIAHVLIQPGAQASVQLKGYKNLVDFITTRVEDNMLIIDTKEPSMDFSTDQEVIAEIILPSLNMLRVNGASKARIEGGIIGPDLEVDISGAGKVWIDKLQLNSFIADLSGAGELKVEGGTAEKAEFSVSGAGSIHSFNLVINDAKADVSGAGGIELNATRLDAEVSGAGNVSYKGKPQLHVNTSGAGTVKQAD